MKKLGQRMVLISLLYQFVIENAVVRRRNAIQGSFLAFSTEAAFFIW